VGRAIALRLAREGYRIAVAGRTTAALDAVRDAITAAGGQASAFPCDVARRDEVRAAIARAEADLGPISVLVNNAGIAESAPFVAMDDELWDRTLAVNLTGAYHCMRAVLPGMLARGHGRIINVASTAAKQGFAYTSAYVASKHGLLGLTRAVALETAGRGVTVNAICPGWIDTEMTGRSVARIAEKTGRPPADARAMLEQMNTRGRLIDPDEVAALAAYLASAAADGVNGQDLDIT
jgi:NAD(P)-dependent dehydrogenase (short-subunit alcohol dehydrogenase family)